MTYRAAAGKANVVSVRARAGVVTVRDDGEALRTGAGCERVDAHTAHCAAPGDLVRPTLVLVDTGDGADRLRVPPARPPMALELDASLGPGDDVGRLAGIARSEATSATDRVFDGWTVSPPGTLGRKDWRVFGEPERTPVQVPLGNGRLAGGPGRDRLIVRGSSDRADFDPVTAAGDDGDDIIIGEAGNEVLDGGSGDDTLSGGPGDDRLSPGPGNDVIRGGPGTDTLVDSNATPVRVDLRGRRARGVGRRARLASIENAATGSADDVLVGDSGPNELTGGLGHNTIRAGRGTDRVHDLGSGSSCGRGRDTVVLAPPAVTNDGNPPAVAKPTEPIPVDCELAEVPGMARIRAHPSVTSRSVTFSRVIDNVGAERLRWDLRAGWGRGGGLLGRTYTRHSDDDAVLVLTALGRGCVARGACRAALSLYDPEWDPRIGTEPLPLVLSAHAL